ncbi:MAG: hypothetical protein HKN98_05850 [Silicimonas sp.]|nr:hypothetical protein [Silicimonas sp.]
MSQRLILSALLSFISSSAFSGEPYDATNGFAASGYDIVAYFSLPRVGPEEVPPPAVAGSEAIVVQYDGGSYAFANAKNRDAFLSDPERYLPEYDGHCAFGTSVGVKAAGNPLLWRIDGGRLYFNGNQFVYDRFRSDISALMSMADANWPDLESKPASLGILEDFDPFAAPTLD